MRLLLSILLVVLLVPGWSGATRLVLFDRDFTQSARLLDVPPGGRRSGRLTLVVAVELRGDTPAFGGFSAIVVRHRRVMLLSDGGNWLDFALRDGRPFDARAGYLPNGPGGGWEKRDRDSESFAIDPVSGRVWTGFENSNEIWRYSARFGHAERRRRPVEMRRWIANGGAESLVRLGDGRFLAIAERSRRSSAFRETVLFSADPTSPGTRADRLLYRPPMGYSPSDAAQLPGGDLLVLNRRFSLPFRFSTKLVLVPRRQFGEGATLVGRVIATFDSAPLAENWEGIAVTREAGGTMIWLVSDADVALVQRTLLAKFRLDADSSAPEPVRRSPPPAS